MYAWIFRNLPGPLWLRIIEALILIAAVVLLLMMYVFPWLNEYISPFTDSTIGQSTQ
ncbi:hypothetical protein [Glutamicibacter protophormiae]|uniref:Uncharacterized protein n=1 Tax=Glutamicibacter protophormiae TaxID=37930 RepID=A0ABS4XN95_GLUPR|nr:hypothetical protein [Glutamicibacter protophormiae]MBP2397989.1 hypothetical protein [Glutamicibacter protophormiae]QRQ78720.1 hypothetical protein JQN66_00110 [Glutamicibacter protophormiae]WPR64783.1 hypothetical protein SLW72_00115 [Glutamicibacter protophormiae]WPR68279.1 hypothetical protein SLW73_00115 [Glutamicibacter protophormiae]GGL96798.1 hypothetical protein GCM10010038_28810 [Glutamicibacter protophormiae]